MRIYIAADHAGFLLKEQIKQSLREKGHQVEDVGNSKLDTADDYPDFVIPAAEKVAKDPEGVGIVLGRSGNGEAISANKVRGVRAALCLDEEMARLARNDNNANVLALGVNFVDGLKAEKIVEVFLDTPFPEKKRHARRVAKITSYEESS